MEKQIQSIIKKIYGDIPEDQIKQKSTEILTRIQKKDYDFINNVNKEKYTHKTEQGKKVRSIYSYPKESIENILCEYLKIKIDQSFKIKYPNRKIIINSLFSTLPVIKDLNDFVIIRYDFKSFFDSVSSSEVYNNYILNSSISRSDKDIFDDYCKNIPFCYAGIQTSNAMTELACNDFDKVFKSKLKNYGVVFCERYVDDGLVILNNYVSKDDVLPLIQDSINDVFKESKVIINMSKFQYISRREIAEISNFDFLGYDFTLYKEPRSFSFKFGITSAKIFKYKMKIKQIFNDYKKTNDMEMLRHRIKLFSSRVVYSLDSNDETCDWVAKGLIENYGELKYHIEDLDEKTKKFMQNIYYDVMNEIGVTQPYFFPRNFNDEQNSIYCIYSNMRRNRSMIFHPSTGLRSNILLKEIKKIYPQYVYINKTYNHIAKDYLEILKIQ
ncbi:MAG: hypothetical protein ACC608_07910 [Anaerofustis sp.]